MKKGNKTRLKIAIVLSLVIALICIFFAIKLTASYYHDEERSLFLNSNSFSFNCPEDYEYIHIELSCEDENPIKYNIVNPAGKIVQTAELLKNSDFFCESTKGMWKVIFEVNKEVKINYKLWEGNLKSIDPLGK